MSTRIVTTQEELNKAIAEKIDLIEIRSPIGVWLQLPDCGSSSVVARESSSVHGYSQSKIKATPLVAVFLHSATVDVTGGVILDHSKVNDMDGAAWCEYHGVTVNRGIATLYKAVNDAWTTNRGTDYSPGSKPSCDDFKDTDECGYGLHFGPTPRHAKVYFDSATKFLAVGVKVS